MGAMATNRMVYNFGKPDFSDTPVAEQETPVTGTGVTYCGD